MSAGHDHHHHHHGPARRAVAAEPTWSILRLSAWHRLAGASVLLAALWVAVARIVGWI
jgi:hypothetical protein